ncbi:MAG: hypothetical protein OEV42_07850 [Deltaproteobacteria bacterium]|nr:hypothetical protein [Deltaproteobacteria bacterium]
MSSNIILPKGLYHDQLISSKGGIADFGWRSNIIVDRCRYLLAAFMKGESSSGIHLLKLGKGQESWDSDPPGPPVRTIEHLSDPGPVDMPISGGQMEFLDAAGSPVPGPTHRLKVSVTIGPGDLPIAGGETSYPLREFGLFGMFGPEEYMIDYVRHPVIHKEDADTLDRTINLIF